jgi:hypothetical protein
MGSMISQRRGGEMYASIRRYTTTSGSDIEEITRRVRAGFAPIISQTPGFIAYYVVDGGGGVVASVSIFERQAGAEESNRRAADWVRQNIAEFVATAPQTTAGTVTFTQSQ